jgi:glycosyltransferase involved in cell wall biosynthesis
MIGKFPPIEGGVSVQQYWSAHELAQRGHQIHVVTNANEVEPRFRMFMRATDWLACEGDYPGGGSVRVHLTERFGPAQRHIPLHNPFATKLASQAARVIEEHSLQLVFSYYLEPYGIAGHLAAEMTGRPHVVRHAGSDVGRLRLNPQFGPLYDYILRGAARIITGRSLAGQLQSAGVDPDRMFLRADFRPPGSFHPDGAVLDLEQLFADLAVDAESEAIQKPASLAGPPYIGIYGKLGEAKGTFDLLRALKCLRQRGQRLSLLVVGRSWARTEATFHDAISELAISDCVMRLPFLPHWRIPEVIRLCQAVCFLERDFPIAYHTPMVPREVFSCGRCLIGSAEVLARQPMPERLVHGWNCLAVRDVRAPDELSSLIAAALDHPERAEEVGRRGYRYAEEAVSVCSFPRWLEALFEAAIEERAGKARMGPATNNHRVRDEFLWTRMALESLPGGQRNEAAEFAAQYGSGAAWALAVYKWLLHLVQTEEVRHDVALDAVRLELQMSGALRAPETSGPADTDGLYRLASEHGGDLNTEILALCPSTVRGLIVEEYEYDVEELLAARRRAEFPRHISKRRCFAAALPGSRGRSSRILCLPEAAVQLLALCNGSRTVQELSEELCRDHAPELRGAVVDSIVEYFRLGMLKLARRGGDMVGSFR